MKKFMLGTLLLIIVSGFWAYPKIQALNTTYHLFDEDKIVENFRGVNSIWPTRELKIAKSPYRYAKGERLTLPESFIRNDTTFDTVKFLKDSWTTGLLVIQDDVIVIEDYYLGNTQSTQNIS